MKIAHYEVYADSGDGWKLQERFAAEQRQDAFNLAKEHEADNHRVKIIKEIFDVMDNSYQESVEYVSNLNRKKSSKGGGFLSSGMNNETGESKRITYTGSQNTVAGVMLKIVLLIFLSLIFANLFVSLLFPLLEIFIEEENSSSVLFSVFFVVFLAMAVPLLLKSIPWYVWVNDAKQSKEVREKGFYDQAEYLIKAYNINNSDPITAPAYPEAPLEYKHYVISFLSETLSKLKSPTVLQDSFTRLGVKLLVFGGCLELARYSRLTLPEANSILYDAFKITDGDKADLEAFYEAKRSYNDNKIAILLTGIGAYLMAHVINGREMPSEALNIAFDKWEKQNSNPQTDEAYLSSQEDEAREGDIIADCMVSIKSDLKFLDTSVPDYEAIAAQTSEGIRTIILNLLGKYKGFDVIEANGITTVRFRKLNSALKFADECLKDIGVYHDEVDNDNMIMRNCCAVTADNPDIEPNLNNFLKDMFEHIYNNEIVLTKDVQEHLDGTDYQLEYLGEKNFALLGKTVELYKYAA
ncbi:MAG: hypothetical protein KHX55_06395 [Proteobacteria bacterium]|nr:hypothetical protein [Pseudomonadota bacterium]